MRVRPISFDDRLSIIDHLDELRSRIFVCVGTLLLAFCICFWQNGRLISILNRALPASAKTGLGDQSHEDATLNHAFRHIASAGSLLRKASTHASGQLRTLLAQTAHQIALGSHEALKALPASAANQERPIVFGVGESFTVTLMVAAYFALMITIPVLLYQLYAFVIPALSKDERRIAVPTMFVAPMLFLCGVVFCYFAILPPAVHFLQGYNSEKFQVVVNARSYYKFEILLLLGIGAVFEIPLLLLALQKVGVITARTLTLNWRYATVLIAVITAALPGVDPVTMTLEMAPLVALYLFSILLLKIVERRSAKRSASVTIDAL